MTAPQDITTEEYKLLNEKLDRLTAEFQALRLELHSTVLVHDTKIAQHEKELVHAFQDIHKLEDKAWRASGAVVLGLISLISAVSVGILTFAL